MSEQRFDPRKELNNLRSSVGRVIEQGIQSVQTAAGGANVRVDVYQLDDEVIIRTNSLDGLDASTIEVSMEGDVLTIRGETKAEESPEGAIFLLRERKFGAFSKSVAIPIPVKANEARASLNDKKSILTVTLPVNKDLYQEIEVTPTE